MDKANKKLCKLRTAKLAVAQIRRAIKKRDYMVLGGDHIPEIDAIKNEIYGVEDFRKDLLRLRAQERIKFNCRFSTNLDQQSSDTLFVDRSLTSGTVETDQFVSRNRPLNLPNLKEDRGSMQL